VSRYWKASKTIAMYIGRRQWERDFDPTQTTAQEIQAENGFYITTQSSNTATPEYIETE